MSCYSGEDEEVISVPPDSPRAAPNILEEDLVKTGEPFKLATDVFGVITATVYIERLPITEITSRAWGIDPFVPISLDFVFSSDAYRNNPIPPILNIHQFGLPMYQLQTLARRFLSYWWSNNPDIGTLLKGFGIPPDENIFNLIRTFLTIRAPTLCNYCMQCDETPMFSVRGGEMLKPFVCSRPLCYFQFTQLRLGADSGAIFDTSSRLLFILGLMTKEAIISRRSELILSPMPIILDDAGNQIQYIYKAAEAAASAAEAATEAAAAAAVATIDLGKLVSTVVRLIPDQSEGEITAAWCSDAIISRLMRWVLDSNRAYITELVHQQIPGIGSTMQFILLMDTPQKEQRFREMKAEHNTIFAFHGSSFENWHSILRNGLYNASGTKLQVNGTAHGTGVYLSPSLSFSLAYSKAGKDGYSCIALCEVIDDGIKRATTQIWTVEDPDKVCTRYLLIYKYERGVSIAEFNTTVEENIRAIREVMAEYAL